MKDEIRIEKMKPEDLSQIYDLYVDLIPSGCPLATIKKYYEMTREKEDYYLAVAKEGGRVLGSAMGIICIALDTPFMVVENVIVRKECRGRGVGKMIFEELDRFAIEKKCEYALLVSSGFRKGAHKFYEAVGYVDDVRGFRKVY